MALVHQIIDFVDDTDRSLLKLAAADAPERVKTAKILTHEERELLGAEQFALVMHTKEAQVLKKFPTTDEANTWLSCRYFEKTAEQLPFVAQKIAATNLRRACLIYGLEVSPTLGKLASPEVTGNRYHETKSMKEDQAHTKSVKTASYTEDGSKHFYALGEKYPMPTADYVKKAASYFVSHHKEFSDAEDRATFAYHVSQRAKELEASLDKVASDTLATYAGSSYGDSVSTQIRIRQDLIQGKSDLTQALSKLAAHKDSTDPEVFAKALHMFDKKAGLTRYYDGYIADAFKATFGKFNKVAAHGYRWEDTQSGLSLSEEQLCKVAEEKYEKIKTYFGSTLADSLKKHGVAIFESLPIDAKTTIAKIAKGTI